jgi:hypothetical protein
MKRGAWKQSRNPSAFWEIFGFVKHHEISDLSDCQLSIRNPKDASTIDRVTKESVVPLASYISSFLPPSWLLSLGLRLVHFISLTKAKYKRRAGNQAGFASQ